MKSSTYRTVAALLGVGSMVVVVPGPSPRTIARTTPNLTPSARTRSAQLGTRTQAQLSEAYGKVPLSFEANRGQTDSRVKFLSRGSGYTLFLTGDEAVLSLKSQKAGARSQESEARSQKHEGRPWSLVPTHLQKTGDSAQGTKDKGRGANDVLRMKVVGANRDAKVTALDELPGKSNYFIGNDPKNWRTDVPTYAKVRCQDVYPGIDLVYYGNQRQLEYDFVVAPGADPKAITLAVAHAVGAGLAPPEDRQGARAQQAAPLRIDFNGDLIVHAEGGEVRFHKPVVYQPAETSPSSVVTRQLQNTTDNGPRTTDVVDSPFTIQNSQLLDSRYVLTADNQIHFEISNYDRTKPLVIDPALVYSSYLGGSGGDSARSLAVDSSGSAYVAGSTGSVDFPTLNAFQGTPGSGIVPGGECHSDAFVAKINAAGSSLVYSTYLGGNCTDYATAVAVDSSGNAYVAGDTGSTDFPTMNAFQPAYHGGSQPGCCDAFVTKLNPAGNALVYSTYLGGRQAEHASGIAADASGNAYVAGWTGSYDFPVANAIQPNCQNCNPDNGGANAFVTKFDATGSALMYSTFLGDDSSAAGLAVDSSGNAYVGGVGFKIPTTAGAYQTSSDVDAPYVTKFNPSGSGLIYSTFLNLANCAWPSLGLQSLAIDSSGNAYVVSQGCLTKLNSTGSALVYSTAMYDCSGTLPNLGIGGSAIAVDSEGNAYLAGAASSTCVNLVGAIQPNYGGGNLDAFVAKVDPTGTAVVFSTYLGGSGDDATSGIAVDSLGNAYVVGSTTSTDFPTVNAFQAANAGETDTFVAKMSTPADTALRISSFTPTSGPVGTSVTINGAQYTGATGVAFNGTSATFMVVSDTQITATVPSGATKGPISVTNSSGTVTSSQAFMEVPLIASFSPTSGILGTAVTITGTSFTGATAVVFSDTPYANYCQYVQGTPSAFTVLSDSQISTSVPSGATSGRLCVTNNGFTATSSSSFTVNGAAPPTISSFSPTSGTAGTPVTITGSHFTGTTAVAFNGTAAGFSVSSDTQLTATVPTVLTATTGPITVTNSVGTGSTSTNFSATPPAPRVTGFSPANGPAGTQLTITGSGFTGTTSVTFGGIPASFTVVSDSQIAATVPGGAINSINYYDQINCIIIVTTPWGTAYVAGPEDQYGNRTFFEVLSTAPPTISSFSPTTAAVGSRITLNGANFTGAYWVSFTGGGTPSGQDGTSFAAPTGISDTQLTITVPSYAQSGPITVYNTAGSVISSASFTVTTSPPMTLSPLFATFGNQVVGTTSGAQTFTLTNNTGSAINMGGIMIGGSNSSDYSHAGTCQANSPVAAGGSCTIDVTFTPTATGTRTATLQVGFSASNSPQLASLTGTGVSSSGGGGGGGSAPAVVQVQNNIDTSGAAFTSFSVPITTSPGDLLVAFVRESSNGTDNFTVTDSSGQTWTQTTSGYNNESDTGPRTGMFYVANSAAVTSVIVNYTTAGGVIKPGIMVMEISGAAISGVLDGSVNHGTPGDTTTSTSGSLTTTNANDILIFATDTSGNESGWTAGTGYATPNNKLTIGASGSNVRMAMQVAVVSSVQTNTTTGMSYANSNWNGNIFAAFK